MVLFFQGVLRVKFNNLRDQFRYADYIYLNAVIKKLMDKFISYYLQPNDFDLDL